MKALFVVLVLLTIPLIVMVVGVIDSDNDKLALCHYLKRMKIRGKIYVRL